MVNAMMSELPVQGSCLSPHVVNGSPTSGVAIRSPHVATRLCDGRQVHPHRHGAGCPMEWPPGTDSGYWSPRGGHRAKASSVGGQTSNPTEIPVRSDANPERGSPGIRRPFSGSAAVRLGHLWSGLAPGSPGRNITLVPSPRGRVQSPRDLGRSITLVQNPPLNQHHPLHWVVMF